MHGDKDEEEDQSEESQRTNPKKDFKYLKRYFEAVHDIYDYRNTKEYMNKTTADKLEIHYSLFERLPTQLTQGSGNWKF